MRLYVTHIVLDNFLYSHPRDEVYPRYQDMKLSIILEVLYFCVASSHYNILLDFFGAGTVPNPVMLHTAYWELAIPFSVQHSMHTTLFIHPSSN
jgi:hypothetical protein